jgi:hypothetical protein
VKLQIQLDSDRVAPEEKIAGRINVVEGGPSRSVTLTISFYERSPGYEAIPFSTSAVVHEGELVTGEAIDFDYLLPEGAPPSLNGKHGELYWELEATSDEPGLDTHVRRRIEVVPAEPQ